MTPEEFIALHRGPPKKLLCLFLESLPVNTPTRVPPELIPEGKSRGISLVTTTANNIKKGLFVCRTIDGAVWVLRLPDTEENDA